MERGMRICSLLLFLSSGAACGPKAGSPIAQAAFSGDFEQVRNLLAQGVDPNGAGSSGESPLLLAVRAGHVHVIQALLRAGADPGQRGGVNDWTPLMHAVHKNQERSAIALLEGGADPNAITGHAETALMMAAGYGQTGMVRILLSRGADPRSHEAHGGTSLDFALTGVPDIDRFTIGKCQTETVQALLEAAPDLARGVNSWPLRVARFAGCREILRLVDDKRGVRANSGPR